jgi:4-amino-4-deoxy-L-arabinose transferase-like glycosyltransferase
VEKMKWLFATLIVTRVFFAVAIDLTYDEAYYWSWSKNLALGYFDHPGMVAWMIKISTLFFGDTNLGVRFFPIFFSILASYAIYYMGSLAVHKKAGEWAAIALQATLLCGIGGFLMTPDVPLLVFWTLTLVALFKLTETGRGEWWLVIGLCAGLGFSSKYSAIFLGISIFIIAINHLKNKWLYVGGVIALLAASPPLIWNMQHDWVSFIKQGSRVLIREFNPVFTLEFLAGQGLLLTPIIAIFVVIGLFKLPRNKYMPILLITSAPLFIFLIWQSLFSRVEGNWAASLLPAAIIIASISYKNKYATPFGFIFTYIILLLIWHKPFNLPPNMLDQLYLDKKVITDINNTPHDGVYTLHYTTNAWLRFQLKNISKVQQIGEPERYLHETPKKFTKALLYVGKKQLSAVKNAKLLFQYANGSSLFLLE